MNPIYPGGLPIALSLTAYNAFLTGLFVLLKRRDRSGLHYFISSFVIFLWGVGISFMLNNDLSADVAKRWGVFSQMLALFIPATWLHFVLIYTEQELAFKKQLYFIYMLTFMIFPFTFTPHFIAGFREMVKIKYYPVPGYAYTAFAFLYGLVVFYSFLSFFLAIRKTSSSEKRKDYQLVCFAWLYAFVAGSLSFLPVYGIPFPQYNFLVMPLWQILLAYAMIRHDIFDLEKILQAVRKEKLAAIGTLAASINHEIRNPLYIIQGLAQSYLANLEEGIFPDKDKALQKSAEILTKTEAQASRAVDIMKRFAMFAKQDVKQEPQLEKVELSQVLSDVLPLVNHELELEKIEFGQDIPQSLPPVNTDRRHLEEILFNLILNACQAIKCHSERSEESGKARIEISAEQQDGHINILIKDNGPGILADRLKQIFEPFYTTKEQGTGLGLYITKQLVERNGGKISVKSKPGVGTSFILEFKR